MKTRLSLIHLLVFSLLQAYAQKAEILTMEREGTAGIYLSEADKTACIIDGGRKGGLAKPSLNGKPILEALLAAGYEHLIVSCSHPHDDHAAGLREIVQSDPNITKFRRITFVDSGYPGSESLYDLFRATHPSYPESNVRYSSAQGRNGFKGLFTERSGLKIENFEYAPKPGATKHGHAIIHHVSLEKDGRRTFLVDFDDAADGLLAQWAEWARKDPVARRPDVVIAPHHNADTVDISSLLDQRIRPSACIITANPRNRFLHPGPQNTVKWVQALGSDHVFVTASHDNIIVNEKGVENSDDAKARQATIDSVLFPMRFTLERQVAELEERALERKLTPAEGARYEELKNKKAAVDTLTSLFKGKPGDGGGFDSGGLPAPISPAPSGPVPSGNAVGDFTRLRDKFETVFSGAAVAQTPSSGLHASASPEAAARARKFSASVRLRPIRGGIILGNSISPKSGKVKTASIIVTNDSPAVVITAEQDGTIEKCVFDGMTATELWCAYNFVKPNGQLRASFNIDSTENGLVGKSGDLRANTGWKFGIHPAVAGTLIARDAMRLDMSIAMGKSQLSAFNLPLFHTYQWYDAPATFRIEDGVLQIRPVTEPHDTLLRIRFWTNAYPSWVKNPSTLTNDFERELVRRAVREAGGESQFLSLTASEQKALAEKIVREITDELDANEGGNVPYDPRRLVEKMAAQFDAFGRIERFARAVGVLHWIADTAPSGLPPMPSHLDIKRFEIPAQMTTDQVRFLPFDKR